MKSQRSALKTPSRSAFTLVELLATILIIAILAGLVIGVGPKLLRTAQKAKCASNLRQIGAAVTAYASDHDGYLPAGARNGQGSGNLITFLSEYTSPMLLPTMASDVFYCPTNVSLGSPPQQGYPLPPSGHYKGFSGYFTNFLINSSIFLITNGDPASSSYNPNGQVKFAAVNLPSKTVALCDMYTRSPSVTNPPVSGLAAASYFDPKNASFFLGRIHNNVGNVLFLDGHVDGFGGSDKIAVKSLPAQTTVW